MKSILTKNEQHRVNNLLAAAKALPRSLSIDIDEEADTAVLTVWKNSKEGGVTVGNEVGRLRKKSLKP